MASWSEIVKSVKGKDLATLQNESKSAASTAAANAAGAAKKNAKAAAVMNNATRLQAATQGAAAAGDAATEGFNQANQSAMATNAAMNQSDVDAQRSAALNQAQTGSQQKFQEKENQKNRWLQGAQTAATLVGGLFSDKDVKSFKHHKYLSKEIREGK